MSSVVHAGACSSHPPRASRGGASHVLHVGYPKTGSKALQRWFAAHPQVGFTPWGIAGFGSAHELVTAGAGSGSLACHVTSHEALLSPMPDLWDFGANGMVPALPDRIGQDRICQLLAHIFPGARIMIVTRGFEAFLQSFYAELVLGGACYDLPSLCRALLAQVAENTDFLDYAAVIAAYEQRFGPENVLVLPQELLRDHPAQFLGDVEAFLGVDPISYEPAIVRPSPPPGLLAWYRRRTALIRSLPVPASVRKRLLGHHILAMRTANSGKSAARLANRKPHGWPPGIIPGELIHNLKDRSGALDSRPRFQNYRHLYCG